MTPATLYQRTDGVNIQILAHSLTDGVQDVALLKQSLQNCDINRDDDNYTDNDNEMILKIMTLMLFFVITASTSAKPLPYSSPSLMICQYCLKCKKREISLMQMKMFTPKLSVTQKFILKNTHSIFRYTRYKSYDIFMYKHN